MPFVPLRLRRVHVVVAISASIVLIVAAVLAWLGWRMSRQETALSRTTSILRLTAAADAFRKDSQWHVGDTEDSLFQVDATTPLPLVHAQRPSFVKRGALLVRLTDAGIESDQTSEASGSRLTQAERLAFSEVVESLQHEWREFGQRGATNLNKRLTTSGVVPTLTLIDANPTRLIAGVYLGEPVITDLLAGPLTNGAFAAFYEVNLVDYLSPNDCGSAGKVCRDLAADLPWLLRVVERPREDPLRRNVEARFGALAARRNWTMAVLILTIGVVFAGCYALARGTLREATAARLQSDFVAAVSHEFRSPLTTMAQFTELLADGRVSEESRRRVYFDVLHQQTSRLHRLVEDLLDFGLVNAGRWQCQFEPLELCQLVRDSVNAYQTSSPAAAITVNVTQPPIWIDGDPESLKRVIRNLLENAAKYSPAQTPVFVDVSRSAAHATIAVRDEGMGIPPHEQRRIFEKFTRGDAAKKACIAGTGIGLAMVKELVVAHGGDVSVDSAIGSGSTFLVTLPTRCAPCEPQS